MKRVFLLAVAALMLSIPSAPAKAAGQRTVRAGNGNGPIRRLIELERRKNAWIRKTILDAR